MKTLLERQAPTPPSAAYRYEMVRTYDDLGYVLWKQGHVLDAGESLRQGLALLEVLLKEDAKNSELSPFDGGASVSPARR